MLLGDIMNYSEALQYIASFKTVSLAPSLDRISALLKGLGNPERDIKAIHIAGTNGKGSVASMIASVLKEAGYKVGLFTSPYIVCFRERIRINGEMISERELSNLCNKVKAAYEEIKEETLLSQFEFITAVAFLYFKKQNCDYVVLETGLGGRFDATNVLPKPICSLITNISLDHTKVLGETLSEIASEKAGIIKEGVPAFSAVQEDEVLRVLESEAKEKSASLFIAERRLISEIHSDMQETSFLFEGEKFNTNLLGAFQIDNAFLSVCAIKKLFSNIKSDVINRGLNNVFHPGRMEMISKNPKIILDGAHNPDAAKKLCLFLKSNNWRGNMIFSAMKDKNYESVLKELAKLGDSIILLPLSDIPRAETGEELKEKASRFFKNCIIAKDIKEALILGGSSVLACGSLYLVSRIREEISSKI